MNKEVHQHFIENIMQSMMHYFNYVNMFYIPIYSFILENILKLIICYAFLILKY
jgi:hypothetical protein